MQPRLVLPCTHCLPTVYLLPAHYAQGEAARPAEGVYDGCCTHPPLSFEWRPAAGQVTLTLTLTLTLSLSLSLTLTLTLTRRRPARAGPARCTLPWSTSRARKPCAAARSNPDPDPSRDPKPNPHPSPNPNPIPHPNPNPSQARCSITATLLVPDKGRARPPQPEEGGVPEVLRSQSIGELSVVPQVRR